ncbi:serine/threonine-protein kinase [Streptomyces sp. NPDC049040]|uniref:serine/threonine-protein kinase n=1 Tax=Streptomyces sp. NPDC049040 TaxID=3365593 RepID=UPI00371139C3
MVALQGPAGRRSPQPGDVLDERYRLDEVLGAGGTADVFRAMDLKLRREVAVKVFRPGATAVSAARFGEEAVLLARLTHPALVAVYDTGRYLGGAYVVMQLVKGVTLRERLSEGRLPPAQAARIGAQLASALAHAHAAGIVHRDVKPSNVLLGPGDAPYLADFGISRLIDEPTRAEPGMVVGTAPYLAPEQMLGKGSGPASDVYALGLVLLEALKGEREYQGTPLAAGTARLFRSPEIPQWVPPELASVIAAMTRSEPAERPDADRCVRALEEARISSTPIAPPDADATTHRSRTVSATLDSPLRSKRRRALVAGTTAALLLGVTGVTLVAMDTGPSAPDAGTRHSAPAGAPADPAATSPAAPASAPPHASGGTSGPAHTPPSLAKRASLPHRGGPAAGAPPAGQNPVPGTAHKPAPAGPSGNGNGNGNGKADEAKKAAAHGTPAKPKK